MRAGDVLNGYTILEDFKVVGAGLSKWTFAERGGRQFFIKEFLSPTYPDENAPGSDKIKAKKRARCAVFEAHHRGVQRALAPLSAYGGNLIVTLDFFRWGAKYYKVTEKVDAAGLGAADVRRLGLRTQLVLMKTVSHSLKILHDLKIVHSDLKPSNVLIKQTELGYTTKLIDFDSSYIAGRPPPPEEIVGTINYYSPELLGYIQEAGVTPAELGLASDVFALGLIYTEYLTGAPPPFDVARYHEPAVAVRSGERLRIPRGEIPTELADLVDAMLAPDPAQRPTIAQVHATLMTIRPEPARPVPAPGSTVLRGKGLRAAAEPAPGTATASAEPAGRQARPETDRPAAPMSVWRCRVCEGVNQGGRVCATCGAQVPPGEPLREAVRSRLPAATTAPPAPPPVPPTPRARELRRLPSPEEMSHAESEDLYSGSGDWKMTPIPGGCLVSFVPREYRRHSWDWR